TTPAVTLDHRKKERGPSPLDDPLLPTQPLFRKYLEFCAAVGLVLFLGTLGAFAGFHRLGLPVTLCCEPVLGNALLDQVVHGALGPLLREIQVVGIITAAVRVRAQL